MEVDFVVEMEGRTIAIEVKTTDEIGSADLEGLRFFETAFKGRKPVLLLLHMGRTERRFGPIRSVPWQQGLKAIGL